jgi:hypothetical protein
MISRQNAGLIMTERKAEGKSPVRTNVLLMCPFQQYFLAVVYLLVP